VSVAFWAALDLSTHQAGNSGGRKNAVRCSPVRQRGIAALAADINCRVVAKTAHSRAVLSADAVTMRLPSGLNAALNTPSLWPTSVPICLPVSASHSRAVSSADGVTTRLPSGLNAALNRKLSWPTSGAPICLPVSASHSHAVSSFDAVTMRLPSGLNAAPYKAPSWPTSVPICLPVSASHSRAVVSQDAVTMRLPSGLNAAPGNAGWQRDCRCPTPRSAMCR
jgi:hypothetical protein